MSDNPSEGKSLRSGFKAIAKSAKTLSKRATLPNLRNDSSTSLAAIKKSKINESNDSIKSFAAIYPLAGPKKPSPNSTTLNLPTPYPPPQCPKHSPPTQPIKLVPDSQQSEAILSAVEAADEMPDDISSGSTPKAAPQELVHESPIPSQASSRGQSQPREEYPRRHFFHDCPDDVDPDDTWMLNAIEWLRLDFLLMEKLSRGRMKADKSTDDKQATNRIISKIEQVMTEGLQEMGQLSIQANEAYQEAISADNEDDVDEIPTSQSLTEGYIDIDMESVEPPIIDYEDFGMRPTSQSHSENAHVPEHEAAPAHPQSEEQSMLAQIMSELKTMNATIQKQQASINRLENGEFSCPPRPTPSITRPSPPPRPKDQATSSKETERNLRNPHLASKKALPEPNTEPKSMSYAKATTNPSNKPKSDAGHIAAAIRKGASPKVLDETKGCRYLVRFSDLPPMRPDTPSLCALLRDTLAANNKTLGGVDLSTRAGASKATLPSYSPKTPPPKRSTRLSHYS
ncbi:hypothetical protein OPQ81_009087 [Rhizoctonia solani]|nr:hypothetical protein OPQ81_009087 [Rhizoctonia solani]